MTDGNAASRQQGATQITTMEAVAPAPLVPSDVSFPGFQFFHLDIKAVTDGDLSFLSGDGFKAAITLMAQSWQETPAASLPADDRRLAALCGFGRGQSALTAWQAVKEEALSDFTLCADGRWYSRTLAPKAVEAWGTVKKRKAQTEAARQARAEGRQSLQAPAHSVASSVTEPVTHPETSTVTTSATGSRLDQTRGDERRSEERRSEGRRVGATSVKVGVGGKGGAGGNVRPTPSTPRRVWRATKSFVGANITIAAGVQNRWADQFSHIVDFEAAMREIEPALSGVPKDDRMSEMKARLATRNDAMATSQSSRQVEEADFPF